MKNTRQPGSARVAVRSERSRGERLHVAFASSYPPRRCGIATFTADLRAGFADSEVVALSASGEEPAHHDPGEAHHLVRTEVPGDFGRIARALDDCDVGIVSVQHEYGIWGPRDGEGVLRFLDSLSVPAVATLHTVLPRPNTSQSRIMRGLLDEVAAVVVMSQAAADILVDRYGAHPERIEVIPHGVADLPYVLPDQIKPALGLAGRQVLLSFGLIGPGKGYETVIEAMPMVGRAIPDAHYVIVGATHPDLLRREGERYRDGLKELASRLGVSDRVEFIDRFVGKDELGQWLQAADIFITPYPNLDQIVSGTLSYAMAAGKAIVSTPYLYAAELLGDGSGALVHEPTSLAMGTTIADLLGDPVRREALSRRAYQRGRTMLWSNVFAQYRALFERLASNRRPLTRISIVPDPSRTGPSTPSLPPVVRTHLDVLSSPFGIIQHARGEHPDPAHGTCTDDVARALRVDLLHGQQLGWTAVESSAARNLQLLEEAFDGATGRFRNFRRLDGSWLDQPGSEDADARALQALAEVMADAPIGDVRAAAGTLFERALPTASVVVSIRPLGAVLLACHAALRAGYDDGVLDLYRRRSEALWRMFAAREHSGGWPWPESVVTYENELPPMALIDAGRALGRPEMTRVGLAVLDWLIQAQTGDGYLSVVGNAGWWPQGGSPARFDQQAISATSMLLAAEIAFEVTGASRYLEVAELAYAWFTGHNIASRPLAVPETGACRDGIADHGVSENQGAESSLMWLMAAEHMRAVRRRAKAPPGVAPQPLAPSA